MARKKIYPTRYRERKALHKRYEAIFACVVKKALSEVSLPIVIPPSRSIGNKPRRRSTSETPQSRSQACLESQCIQPATNLVPTINSVLSCRCGVIVGSHARLHEHVLYEHSYPISLPCSLCCASDELIRQKHICNLGRSLGNSHRYSLCNVFADDLEEHLKMHYQDRTSSGALMECRMCFKNFLTVQEVILHERVSHEKLRGPPPTFQCEYCGEVFPTRHLRDNHLLSHFEGGVSEFWDRVQHMQNKMADAIVVNQCPICLSIMGSRKGFRLHIIQKHLLKEPEAFLELLRWSPFTPEGPVIKQEPHCLVDLGETSPSDVVVKTECVQ
ncbi:Zinc finger C2H2 type [Trichostrongylus colubriformis]|uniref:Zinc finger C2H2 type n=1 Tax=Trichostrongylus colubriformis TaxID=6319 RepID=A0AAN8GBB8_TRICO